jgi:hypothetical protein
MGRWGFALRLSVCGGICTVGQTITVNALFDNLLPMTDIPQATGSATVANTSYPFPLEFGGPLRFVAPSFTLPALEPGSGVEIQVPDRTIEGLSGRRSTRSTVGVRRSGFRPGDRNAAVRWGIVLVDATRLRGMTPRFRRINT